MERVHVGTLLSTCVDAATEDVPRYEGCSEREEAASDDEEAFVVTRKEASDPRSALTEADLAAQSAIASALRARWPTANIVGEEDGSAGGAVDES